MPFCQKCGLFFAKGKECSCVTGGDPAEAAKSTHAPPEHHYAVPGDKPRQTPAAVVPAAAAPAKSPRRTPPVNSPPPSRPAVPASDRGEVVSERSSTSAQYCGSCSEPKALCKCRPDQGEPFYGRNKAAPAPVNSVAFCSVCNEPRGLCTCRSNQQQQQQQALPSVSPRLHAAREESDRQCSEPARGAKGGSEVVKEGLVMGGSNFCAECGEPRKLCRCQSIREGRQIQDPATGKWL